MTTSNDPISDLMPEAGTWAHKVITLLRGKPPGSRMTTAALCEAVGHPVGKASSRMPTYLLESVRRGLLHRQRISGAATLWGLGYLLDRAAPEPEEPEEALQRQTVRSVSAAAVSSVFALADERRAAPFSVALSSDGRVSIERYGRLICELTDSERRQLLRAAGYGVVASEVAPL